MRAKKILITALLIFIGAAGALFTQAEKIRIAVAPFDDSVTAEGEAERAGTAAAQALRGAFSSVERFFVREPGAIQGYFDTLTRVQAGLAEPDTIRGQSENLLVKYLTVGTVSKFEGLYDADARTVNIDTWVIVHSHGATAGTLADALGDISWSVKNQFTGDYLKDRDENDPDRPVVSVTGFSDYNIPAQKRGYSGAFSEILNGQMGSFILISTVEGKYARALLEEKALEMAGVIGNDDSGAGLSIRGIQYRLAGDIRVFSDLICINYRLQDTSDGRTVYQGSKEIAGRKGLRPAAWSISCEIEDVLNSRIGTVKIGSTPPSAEVYIDGGRAGATPFLGSLSRGHHTVTLKLSGYKQHEEALEVLPKKITEKNIRLQAVTLELMMKAMSLERQGKWGEAVESYQKFIDEYGGSYEADNALYRKGHVLLVNVKDYAAALNAFKSLVARYPDTMTRAEAYFGMMKTYMAMGEREKARETAEYMIKNYPEAYATEEARGMSL